MKWVKASERMPVALKDRQRINIKYKGVADSIINISGRWYWNNDVPTEYLISQDSWLAIEWLDESTTSVSAIEDGWVNVEDKLPEEEEWVLVYNNLEENCAVTTGVFVKGRWGILELGVDAEINVTHWRPLPPPPSNR